MSENLAKELERLRKDKRKAENKNDLKEVALVCNVIGELYTRHGRHEDALSEHRTELGLSEALQDTLGTAIAERKIGECYCQMERFDDALRHQTRHLVLARQCNDLTEEQRALATIGRTYLVQSESVKGEQQGEVLSKAEESFVKALELCERLRCIIATRDYQQMRARLLLNCGLVFDAKGDGRRCSDYIKQATVICQKNSLVDDHYRCQLSMAGIYDKNNNTTQALRCVEEALGCARKMADKECEIESLTLKAQMFVQVSDYSAAKKCLKLAYKCRSPVESTRTAVERQLKSVLKLCRLDEELTSSEKVDSNKMLPLYEKLADLLANMSAFEQAFKLYEKALDCALEMNKPPSSLAPLYVSLAQTCSDLRQYDRAVEFYRKELGCRQGDFEQACRTHLNIAEAQENGKEDYNTLVESYRSAYDCAMQAKHKHLQVTCIKSLSLVQESQGMTEDLEKTQSLLNRLKKKYEIQSDEELSEDEGGGGTNGSDSDESLGDLSDSDASDEELSRQAVVRQGARRTKVKLNEKGETPLHRACIEGNLKKVQKLIEQGHPVNPRDFCGWLPLHEASNHDHLEIVRYLLDHGAHINDRGGDKCGGITPLHDAASCGNTEVIQLLVQRGARLYYKDDDGNTALDCLQLYKERSQDDLDRQALADIRAAEKLLSEGVSGGAKVCPALPPVDDLYDTEVLPTVKKTQKKKPIHEILDDGDDEDSETIYLQPEIENYPESPSAARTAYRKAMCMVGSSATRLTAQTPLTSTVTASTEEIPALINEDEALTDDWLIDDMQPSKRKRVNVNGLFTTNRKNATSSSNSRTKLNNESVIVAGEENSEFALLDSDSNSLPDNDETRTRATIRNKRKRRTQLKMTHFGERTSTKGRPSAERDDGSESSQEIRDENVSVSTDSSHVPVLSAATCWRVKVRVKDKVLLIPISDTTMTIGWLAQQASQRYYNLVGVKPQLYLTKEGAVLEEKDQVTLVLTLDEEVTSVVENWDLPPLADRYVQACKAVTSTMYTNIKSSMASSEVDQVLNLRDLSLSLKNLSPIFRALQFHTSLKELHLQGNKMCDVGMKSLSSCLSTLTGLSVLEVSCNNITHVGLKLMSDLFTCGEPVLQSLTRLDLSFNPLGDCCTASIVDIIKNCPLLVDLDLQSCDLTAHFFQSHRLPFTEACQGRGLTRLHIALNKLGSTGTELLLKSADTLHVLDLNGVVDANETNQMCHHLLNYFRQEHCVLQTLCLSNCHLSSSVTRELACCFTNSASLKKVILSGNPRLCNRDVTTLLESFVNSKSRVQTLWVESCGLSSPLDSDFLDSLSKLLDQPPCLRELSLTCAGINKVDVKGLEYLWQNAHGTRALHKQRGHYVQLTVSDS